ncbi:hypothetical protein [Brochothrix campestris]|uniref:hypothetical protein n=1 Tax=Brochothrix campestris TaxID=2757 RepID=UPI0018DBA78C|nr:hypothetical protein [Brochothrix campestris]
MKLITMIDYVQTYIDSVERGEIIVSDKIKKAINRHKRDLLKSESDEFGFYYSVKHTQNIIKFVSMLPDPKTGKPNTLAKFQMFILAQLWGWRKKNRQHSTV